MLGANHVAIFVAKGKKTENVSTVGVDVSKWVYPNQAGYVFKTNRPSVKFSTWDFGGQVNLLLYCDGIYCCM